MNTDKNLGNEKKYNKLIVVLSVVIPIVVALLFGIKLDIELPIFLPPVYAIINALTALVLVLAFIQIKNGNVKAHERLNKFAILLSVLFLVMYVLYHMTSDSTKYLGDYAVVYYIILISHIILSVVVIPFVLITYARAITNNFELHKRIAKITFPLWLYVAITGVIVYVMIAPYYN
ncbi:hypothetical protein PK35_09600 [Tamlana nanhaiensis]|uniref:YozB n=1 Tax=Neotamlana nanhaiensis TaxID=1382798 RepID=A0A0D7W178_9FLAO|nr:DUF420 domain-containing protein [Tamlana nanhaiensis]KJD32458.1 hypothetical protein PK35_09600 [Tamlana nanhaiensis]